VSWTGRVRWRVPARERHLEVEMRKGIGVLIAVPLLLMFAAVSARAAVPRLIVSEMFGATW